MSICTLRVNQTYVFRPSDVGRVIKIKWKYIVRHLGANLWIKLNFVFHPIEPDPNITEAKTEVGLIRGHAYSITKVLKAQIDTGRKTGLFPLIRIRNPWGEGM